MLVRSGETLVYVNDGRSEYIFLERQLMKDGTDRP